MLLFYAKQHATGYVRQNQVTGMQSSSVLVIQKQDSADHAKRHGTGYALKKKKKKKYWL